MRVSTCTLDGPRFLARELRPGDRYSPDCHSPACECGRRESVFVALSAPRADGVNPGIVHLRATRDGGAPEDVTWIGDAVLVRV